MAAKKGRKKAESVKKTEEVKATAKPEKAEAVKAAPKAEKAKEEAVKAAPKAEKAKVETVKAAAKPEKAKTETVKAAPKAEKAKEEAVKAAPKTEKAKAEEVKTSAKEAPKAAAEKAPASETKTEKPAAVVKREKAPVTEVKKEPAPVVEVKKEPAPVVEVKKEPAPVAEVKTAAKPEVKAEAKAETKPEVKAEAKPEVKAEAKPEVKAETKTEVKPEAKAEAKPEVKTVEEPVKKAPAKRGRPKKKETPTAEIKADAKAEQPAGEKKAEAKAEVKQEKAAEAKSEVKPEKPVAEKKAEAKPEAEEPAKKAPAKRGRKKKSETPAAEAKPEVKAAEEPKAETKPTAKAEEKAAPAEEPKTEAKAEEKAAPAEEPKVEVKAEEPKPAPMPEPRRSVAFIGSECYPFVKTGGLGDVMYALPRALVAQNIDVHVLIPRYKCIKQEWQEKMVYKGAFDMDLCSDGKRYYVGIMEYVHDGVVYDFIDNEEFFSSGNPYLNLVDDIPKFCYFAKAALAALNYMNWIPDIIHCHDWQAALVPVYLREMFRETPLNRSKTILTIHNLRFQGVYNIPTIKYWTNLPDYVFNKDALAQEWTEANMLKGGLTYCNMITTVSNTYAGEIQTPEYGEGLDAHLRYHSGKLRGIVNGIDYALWDPSKDKLLAANYDASDVIEKKKINKKKLQEELGLEVNEDKMVIGLISRLTNQKGLDLVNAIIPQMMDGNTQFIVLGTGDPQYEDSFRYYENAYKGSVCSNIMYDEGRAHKIYAGCDALLVPSRFEPCGLTQLIAMHYGTIPVVRETGGLKDTVLPYNMFTNEGNGYTFDRYETGLLLDAINRAKTLYFTGRNYWDDMVIRDMNKDVSWDVSAKQYRQLYLDLT